MLVHRLRRPIARARRQIMVRRECFRRKLRISPQTPALEDASNAFACLVNLSHVMLIQLFFHLVCGIPELGVAVYDRAPAFIR